MTSPDARGRWMRAAQIGGGLGLIPQAWMLTAGTWNPFRWGRQSDFYEVQARALLDGTLSMDQRVLGIESFARGDQHFMYFGPVPALLRIPFVAFTRSLDGRLAALSMFCALLVMLVAVMRIGWGIRERVRACPVSRLEAVGVASTTFAVIGASSLLFAASRTWVYHEAILWGVALTLAAIATLLHWLDVADINSRRAHALLALTSGLVMLALLTRPSVAGGALAALGLVAAQALVQTWLSRRRATASTSRNVTAPTALLLSAAVVLPVVVYSIVNWLKFRRLLGVPFDQQGYTLLSEQRREMLAANGGTLFNWKFVPTNLLSYLRPDLVGIDGTFPFLQLRRPMTTIGAPVYDLIDLTSGVPTTMPLLVLLGLVGAWALVKGEHDSLRPLRLVLLGCLLGTVAVLAIGYLANRYQSDFLPLLIVSAFVGLPVVTRWLESLPESRSPLRNVVLVAAAALLCMGLLANLAFGYSYQRAYGPSTHPEVVAEYLQTQQRVDDWLGDGRLSQLTVTDRLTARSALGDVAIIGDCEAMYLSDGGVPGDGRLTQWRLAELTGALGAQRGTVTLDANAQDALPVVHVAAGDVSMTVVISVDRDDDVMTTSIVTRQNEQEGPDLPLRTGTALDWQVFADPLLGRLEVFLDGRFAAFADMPIGRPVVTTIGRNVDQLPDVVDDAAEAVAAVAVSTPVCARLLEAVERSE